MAYVGGGTAQALNTVGFDLATPALRGSAVFAGSGSVIFVDGNVALRLDGTGLTRDQWGHFYGTVSAVSYFAAGAVAFTVQPLALSLQAYVDLAASSLATGTPMQAVFLAGSDLITGTGWNDSLVGWAGADTILGGNGNDTIIGTAEANVIDGGPHADSMMGGAGDDTYVVDWGGDAVLEAAGGGADTIYSWITLNLPAEVEHLRMLGSALGGGGNALDNDILGNAAANLIDGQGGDDSLHGEGGDDTLLGRSGNDVMDGGAGADAMDGGEGNDQLTGGAGADVIFGRWGRDTIDGEDGNDTLYGDSNGVLDGVGDVVRGGAGRDLIVAGNGADSIEGGAGDDVLYGSALGADTLLGGGGVDSIVLGAAGAVIAIRNPADVLGTSNGADAVVGFKTAGAVRDVIDLRGILDVFVAPDLETATLRALGWIRVVQAADEAWVQLDGNGGGDGFATVARLWGVTASAVADDQIWVR